MGPGRKQDAEPVAPDAGVRANGRRRAACILGIGLAVVAVFLGVWALLPEDSKPLAAVVALVLVCGLLWIGFELRRLRQREDREIERFKRRPKIEGDEFLDAVAVDRSSEFAQVALAARATLAELGCVPPESIGASDHFFPDLEKLPFYDSIDVLGVVLTLEDELDIRISEDDGEVIVESVAKGTVADVVEHAVRIYREQHGVDTE